jgi:hypothetical protein
MFCKSEGRVCDVNFVAGRSHTCCEGVFLSISLVYLKRTGGDAGATLAGGYFQTSLRFCLSLVCDPHE